MTESRKASFIKDYFQKSRDYKVSQIFRYSDTNKLQTLYNIILLVLYQLAGKRFATKKVNNYKMTLDLHMPGLSKVLFVYGKRELMDTFVVKREIKRDMNVLEVGANIGYYAVLEASQMTSGKIYAFEPDPRNIELLRKNIDLNNFRNKVEVLPYAASNENETRVFNLGDRTNVSSFVERDSNVDTMEVKCIKLDDFDKINEIDFIRMDIEGYECKVLEGLRATISDTSKNLKILMELHHEAYNKEDMDFRKQLNLLLSNGFSVKYLITTKNYIDKFTSRGYQLQNQSIETKHHMCLFENIKDDDALYFLDKKMIRSLMVERT